MEPNLRLQSASADKVVNWEQFQRLVGRLIYPFHTQLDIVFLVSVIVNLCTHQGKNILKQPTEFSSI